MYDEATTIVNVTGSDAAGYTLSRPAQDLYIAFEVVRRHETDGGVFFSQLVRATKGDDGYAFEFDTGDVFTASSETDLPTSETCKDVGTFVVTFSGTTAGDDADCDHTFAEVKAAYEAGKKIETRYAFMNDGYCTLLTTTTLSDGTLSSIKGSYTEIAGSPGDPDYYTAIIAYIVANGVTIEYTEV